MTEPLQITEIMRRVCGALGDEAFAERYPNLQALFNGQERPSAEDIFLTLRSELSSEPDLADAFLMLGARRDLQQSVQTHDFAYLDASSAEGIAIRAAIGERMNLPFRLANYLCHLSRRHRLLYVATPKVGCTAIKHMLQQAELGGRLTYRRYGDEHNPVLSPLLAPLDEPDLFDEVMNGQPGSGEDWFRFTFVRNPFVRVLSCYLDKIVNSIPERIRLLPILGLDPKAGMPDFRTFLEAIAATPVPDHDVHWAPQAWLLQPDHVPYDFIGRMERFDADLEYVCDRLGIDRTPSPPAHSTGAAEQIASHYGPEEAALVRSIYGEDFKRFDYDERAPLR